MTKSKNDKQANASQAGPEWLDPLFFVRQWVATFEEQANGISEKVGSSKAFNELSSRMLSGKLEVEEAWATHMERQLHMLNMPTRNDITAVADRIAELSERMDRMERVMAGANSPYDGSDTFEMPPRTRKAGNKGEEGAG